MQIQKPGKEITEIYPIKIKLHNNFKIFVLSCLGLVIISQIMVLIAFFNSYPDEALPSFILLLMLFIMTGFIIYLYKIGKPVIFSNCHLYENGISLNINGYKGFINYKNIKKINFEKDQKVSNIHDDQLLLSGKGDAKNIDKVNKLIIIKLKEPQSFYYLNRRPEKKI